jgi:hypothetical protein
LTDGFFESGVPDGGKFTEDSGSNGLLRLLARVGVGVPL